VIGSYHKCVAETVARFDGFVAKYMGDGVLVYFGYPHAHEDDAMMRSPRCELRWRSSKRSASCACKSRSTCASESRLAWLWLVTSSALGRPETGVAGESRIWRRVSTESAPNAVVVAEGTRRLLGTLFELRDLGRKDLKGIAVSAQAWAVLRASSFESRFEALRATGLTALVGRKNLNCSCSAGAGERLVKARWCCSAVKPGLENPASRPRCWNAWPPNRTAVTLFLLPKARGQRLRPMGTSQFYLCSPGRRSLIDLSPIGSIETAADQLGREIPLPPQRRW
jgi:hypothetical protein